MECKVKIIDVLLRFSGALALVGALMYSSVVFAVSYRGWASNLALFGVSGALLVLAVAVWYLIDLFAQLVRSAPSLVDRILCFLAGLTFLVCTLVVALAFYKIALTDLFEIWKAPRC